jgi:hypothetical protein
MRLLAEILIVGGLISLGWEQPFKERLEQVETAIRAAASKLKPTTIPQEAPVPVVPAVTATPVPQPK